MAMTILEAGGKERFQRWMQEVKRRGQWHGAIRSGMVSTIGKMTRRNARLIGRRVTVPLKEARKRVCAFHKQLKNQHCQPEQVVFRSSIEVGKVAALKLGCRKLGSAHGATVNHAILGLANLEGIRVYKRHQSRIRDEDVGRINITDHVPASVQGAHRGREIVTGAMQVAIAEKRTSLTTGPGIVIFHDGPHPGDPPHEESDHATLAVGRQQQFQGPGDRDMSVGGHRIVRCMSDHGGEFARVRRCRAMIHFGHQVRVLRDGIDARLSSNTDGRGGV
jgi:hypothetical protein